MLASVSSKTFFLQNSPQNYDYVKFLHLPWWPVYTYMLLSSIKMNGVFQGRRFTYCCLTCEPHFLSSLSLFLNRNYLSNCRWQGQKSCKWYKLTLLSYYRYKKMNQKHFLSFGLETKQERNRKLISYVTHKIVPYSSQDILTLFTWSTPWMLPACSSPR